MNHEALERIARQWITLWSVPTDWTLFEALHDEGFEDCAAAGRPSDRQGFAQGIRALTAAFPDLATVADDLVIDTGQARVAIRWSATGNNRARYLGIGPTHRETTIRGIEIIEVRDGRIVRRWGEWDISDHRAEA